MKNIRVLFTLAVFILLSAITVNVEAQAKIKKGVAIGDVDVSGMTVKEAKAKVQSFVEEQGEKKVYIDVTAKKIETTLKDLGYVWINKEVAKEAKNVGNAGNIIRRYRESKQINHEGVKLKLDLGLDESNVEKNFKKVCEPYNVEAKNASLKPTGHGFKIIPGEDGVDINYADSSKTLYDEITKKWDGKSEIVCKAKVSVSHPKYTEEDCEKVSDTPMGSFTTTYTVGSIYDNRNLNILNGSKKIDGTILYPNEEYSCNEHLAPWTEKNGWHPAGTYVDGGVEDSLGGGICQVSSTLYNALLEAEIKVVERYSHSMPVHYVDLAADAALAGDYKDLKFVNDTDAPIYIQSHCGGGEITFNVYGHDTRKKSHRVEYVSEITKTIPIKKTEKKDPSKPAGYSEVEKEGSTGYVATLTKITYEHGKKVKSELLHTSTYAMQPEVVIKGTKKGDDGQKNKEKETKDEKQTEKPHEKTTKKLV